MLFLIKSIFNNMKSKGIKKLKNIIKTNFNNIDYILVTKDFLVELLDVAAELELDEKNSILYLFKIPLHISHNYEQDDIVLVLTNNELVHVQGL
jgi:hypothetical protein